MSAALADQSVQCMGEIVRFIPGVTFGQSEGHRDAPAIRGNASTADFFLHGVRDDAPYAATSTTSNRGLQAKRGRR